VKIEELTEKLKTASTWSDRRRIEHEFARLDQDVAFHLLYAIATTFGGETPHEAAASILLELQPPCPLSCEDALRMLARTDWNVSDRLVPFYLVTQFGQRSLVHAVNVVKTELDGEGRTRVIGVSYWAEKPAAILIEHFVAQQCQARQQEARNRLSE